MADNGRWASWASCSDRLAPSTTLPEHHSALALLQQLDHAWFHDNLLKPRVGIIHAFLPSSQPLPPYQSVELTDAAHCMWAASSSSQRPRSGRMPCAHFEALSCSLAVRTRPLSGTDSSNDLHLRPHRPPQRAQAALVSQRHVFANPLADTVLVPPATLQAWVVKDLRNLKEFEANAENIRARNLKSAKPGKQLRVSLVDEQLPQRALRVFGSKRATRKSSKSMTALEFDELQGFMDLGFNFSQDDLTPRIVSMFPALRHKFEEDGGSKESPRTILTKPKQSSAATWLVRRSAAPLHRWQAPATSDDMKEHLKFWARAVALTVRQEC